jgi:hypothetical protein
MEVDYRAVDEHKESSSGAVLHSPQPLSLPPFESSVLSPPGQQQIWKGCPTLSKLKQVLIDAPVCALCWCVDAPLVQSGASPRMDLYRNQLCELCDQRLSRVKHHRVCGAGRACHPRCKPSKHASDATSVSSAVVARSHKRSQLDPGQQTSLDVTPPLPLLPVHHTSLSSPHQQSSSLFDSASWPSHRWQFAYGNRARTAMCNSWHSLVSTQDSGGFAGWTEMRSQFFEQNMRQQLLSPRLEHERQMVVSSAEKHARNLLSNLSVDEQQLQLSDIGCLRTDHNIGLQEIHADIQQHQYAHLCYIVIFYLCATDSTAVSLATTEQLAPLWDMTVPQAKAHLSSVQFRSSRVAAGTALVMRGDTFHYGVGNPDLYHRYVGFLSFTPKSLPPFDSQEQFYPTGVRYES